MNQAPATKHPYTVRFWGQGVSKGFALGKILRVKQIETFDQTRKGSKDEELTRFRAAHKQVKDQISKLIEKAKKEIGPHEAEIFEAHLQMIEDEELLNPIYYSIEQEQASVELALKNAFQTHIAIFESADTSYLRERALDLKDLYQQFISALHPEYVTHFSNLREPVILAAHDFTPSQTVTMDRNYVLGMITEAGGETSHSAIIAKTLGIPLISSANEVFTTPDLSGKWAMDGAEGTLFQLNSPETETYFQNLQAARATEKKSLEVFRGEPSRTKDGASVSLYGNIGSAKDANRAWEADVDGIGLYRTEFLFMERDRAPSLDEQIEAYSLVLEKFKDKEVVIRTLDVGGDKPISYIPIKKEENPFLGLRAVRYCLLDQELFKTQIKALLLSNRFGNLSIMIPMVSRSSELKSVHSLVEECKRELEGNPAYLKMPFKLGTMVEIPSLVFEIDLISKWVSFVSVGTNDLLQYSLAVDRMNPAVQNLYNPYHIGFIRLMDQLSQSARAVGLSLSICGELGGKDEFVPLWVGMGYQKLSMTLAEVLPKRKLLHSFTTDECKNLKEQALSCQSEVELKTLLQSFNKRANTI